MICRSCNLYDSAPYSDQCFVCQQLAVDGTSEDRARWQEYIAARAAAPAEEFPHWPGPETMPPVTGAEVVGASWQQPQANDPLDNLPEDRWHAEKHSLLTENGPSLVSAESIEASLSHIPVYWPDAKHQYERGRRRLIPASSRGVVEIIARKGQLDFARDVTKAQNKANGSKGGSKRSRNQELQRLVDAVVRKLGTRAKFADFWKLLEGRDECSQLYASGGRVYWTDGEQERNLAKASVRAYFDHATDR